MDGDPLLGGKDVQLLRSIVRTASTTVSRSGRRFCLGTPRHLNARLRDIEVMKVWRRDWEGRECTFRSYLRGIVLGRPAFASGQLRDAAGHRKVRD
jgi:hypothetical protein